jgi:glycosyltransferase involved in cell wall biosynthesis
MKFTLVSTVFNEAKRLQTTLEDISNQTRLPDEVIITDAGSTDQTVEILTRWASTVSFPVQILSWPRCNVAQGRNRAIEAAGNDLILSTDFGCRFHSSWIEEMLKPFNDPSVQVVGGTYEVIESDITTRAAKANYIICEGYYVAPHPGFIPSSRSIAYYKNVWEQAGRYPEWLTLAADDLVFGMVVLKQVHKIAYVDTPYVYWGRHTTLKAYGKEAYRYGLGDGEAQVNLRQFLSKSIELGLRCLFVLSLLLIPVLLAYGLFNVWICIPLIIGTAGFRPYYWAFKNWLRYRSEKYSFNVFLFTIPVIELSRINYLKAYIKGYLFSSAEVKRQAKQWKEK